jgi:prepilin-type N-terminal cleavage/methylation domain-containing protein
MPLSPADFHRARALRAFTLLELVAVIAIVAVLAGLVVGAAGRASESGRIARTRAELAALATGLEAYRRVYGDYPQTNQPARLLQSLLGELGPGDVSMHARALIELARFTTSGGPDPAADPSAVLVDPWGRPYTYAYKVPPDDWLNPSFLLYSLGPDGQYTPDPAPDAIPDPTLPGNADNISADVF